MSDKSNTFRQRAARAIANVDHKSAADGTDRYTRMADAVIVELAKPTDAMIDAAYEAVRFDEGWAINSRCDFVKAVKAMVRSAPSMSPMSKPVQLRAMRDFSGY